MVEEWVCWKCGASIDDQPRPLARLAACAACRSDLHVCRLCAFYDTRAAKACREPVADEVQDKERANFCGYFQLRAGAYRSQGAAGDAARVRLEALFGAEGQGTAAGDEDTGGRTEGERARARLEQLFNNKDGGGEP